MRLAARTYEQIHDAAPISLEALVEEGLLERSDLRYPSAAIEYSLRLDGEHVEIEYTLESGLASPDEEASPEEEPARPDEPADGEAQPDEADADAAAPAPGEDEASE